jgi:hypothetical protein
MNGIRLPLANSNKCAAVANILFNIGVIENHLDHSFAHAPLLGPHLRVSGQGDHLAAPFVEPDYCAQTFDRGDKMVFCIIIFGTLIGTSKTS